MLGVDFGLFFFHKFSMITPPPPGVMVDLGTGTLAFSADGRMLGNAFGLDAIGLATVG